MVMSKSDAATLLGTYLPSWAANHDYVSRIDRWYRGELTASEKPSLPSDKKPTAEYRELRERAMTRWLKYVVRSLAQGLYVEGYRRSDQTQSENQKPWQVWQANGLDARQIPIHRNAMAHALSYVVVLPGEGQSGSPLPVVRGYSARKMMAFYQDVATDEWPMFALRGDQITAEDGSRAWRFRLYDEEAIYLFDGTDKSGGGLTYIETKEHGVGVCPVVRYVNEIDLEGRADGEVEPNIDLAARIDQDTFDRLIVQRFGAWAVRWIAGLEMPAVDADRRAEKLRAGIEDVLISESPDTKFGALPTTPLSGFIEARDSDIRDLAVVTQTPPQDLLGQMVNLSAEALAAAEAGRTRKWEERKHTFGEAHEQMLRLAGHVMGDEQSANDFSAQVVWRDMESRSLAQVADAFGKLVQMLGVPPEVLWEKLPGWTQQDVERAKALVAQHGGIDALIQHLEAASAPPGPPAPAPAAAG
jgi:hypothetical protein